MQLNHHSGVELIDLITKRLRDLHRQEKTDGVSFSAKRVIGKLYLFDEFIDLIIPKEAVLIIKSSNILELSLDHYQLKCIKSFKDFPDESISLKDFIEASGGLTRALIRIKLIEKCIRDSSSCLISHDEYKQEINNYILGLSRGLEHFKIFTKRNKPNKVYLNKDYCLLCWKRVPNDLISKQINIDANRAVSSYYCYDHHPTRSTGTYNLAIRALIKAVRDEKPDFDDLIEEIDSGGMDYSVKRSSFEIFMKNFFKKDENLNLIIDSGLFLGWEKFIPLLINHIKVNYKFLSKKIKLSSRKRGSWKNWVLYEIIDKIDDSLEKYEMIIWQADSMKYGHIFEYNKQGLISLFNLFKRYETYHYIMNRPRPRGPKPNLFKEDTPLQLKVKKLLQEEVDAGRKIVGKDIALLAGTTPKTVSKIKNNMGF